MDKKMRIISGIGIIIAIALIAVFRHPLLRLFSFDTGVTKQQTEGSIKPEQASTSEGNAGVHDNTPASGKISYASLIPYQGRDPAEVVPDNAALKNTSETGRAQLYADIRTYGAMLKKNPDDLNMWLHLGLLKKNIGDYAGARDAWEYAVRINPLHHIALRNLGELYWRYIPDFPKAEADFREAIKIQPKDDLNYTFLVDFYRYGYKEKSDLRESVLLEGIKQNSSSGTLYRALADFYESKGVYQKAADAWKQILAIEPNNPNAQDMIDEFSRKAGK